MDFHFFTPDPLLDVHAHLCDALFERDREEVLRRARAAGVGGVVAVGETLADAESNLSLAEAHPGEVWASAGLYPTHLDLDTVQSVSALIRRHRSRLVSIGEVGLDYWVVKAEQEREVQREIFERFVRLALELEMPLNVHSRSAGRATVEILRDLGARLVLMHGFDGRASSALAGVEAGYFFSIPPSVVRSRQKQKLVARLPLESILLETDSPVLGPDPHERNEPANLLISLNAVAELKELSVRTVVEAVVKNQRRLFGDLRRS